MRKAGNKVIMSGSQRAWDDSVLAFSILFSGEADLDFLVSFSPVTFFSRTHGSLEPDPRQDWTGRVETKGGKITGNRSWKNTTSVSGLASSFVRSSSTIRLSHKQVGMFFSSSAQNPLKAFPTFQFEFWEPEVSFFPLFGNTLRVLGTSTRPGARDRF